MLCWLLARRALTLYIQKVTRLKLSGIATCVKIQNLRSGSIMTYIGIDDIAKKSHFASAVNLDKEVIVKPFKFTNDD